MLRSAWLILFAASSRLAKQIDFGLRARANTVDECDDSALILTPFAFKVVHAGLERCFGDHAKEEEF